MGAPSGENRGSTKHLSARDIASLISNERNNVSTLFQMTLGLSYGDTYARVQNDENMRKECLVSPDPRLRELALLVIANTGQSQQDVTAIILDICKSDRDTGVRRSAIYAIASLCNTETNLIFLTLLARIALDEAEDNTVRKAAYQGLVLAHKDARILSKSRRVMTGEFSVSDFDAVYLAGMLARGSAPGRPEGLLPQGTH
jgi:hypothetical protein